jgi:hypothetical protein
MNARFRFLLGFMVVLNGILLVLISGMLVNLNSELDGLRNVLATKQDLVSVSMPEMRFFHEEKCTSCHTERRFAGDHNVRGEIEAAVSHMQQMPDAGFTDDDVARIHSSLSLLRCTKCHGEEKLFGLALESPEERMTIIRDMIAQPGSMIGPDETQEIQRAYGEVFGF